jgi:hypothetical protein
MVDSILMGRIECTSSQISLLRRRNKGEGSGLVGFNHSGDG